MCGNPVSGSGCFLSECAADQREPGTRGTLTHTKETQYLLCSQNTLGDAACATRWVNFGSKRWIKLDERQRLAPVTLESERSPCLGDRRRLGARNREVHHGAAGRTPVARRECGSRDVLCDGVSQAYVSFPIAMSRAQFLAKPRQLFLFVRGALTSVLRRRVARQSRFQPCHSCFAPATDCR